MEMSQLELPAESVVKVTGKVMERPEGMSNKVMLLLAQVLCATAFYCTVHTT